MIIGGLILGLLFAVLVIAFPFIFKIIFKIESFFGYCIGICCVIITNLVLAVVFLIEVLVIVPLINKNKGDLKIEINAGVLSNMSILSKLSFGFRLLIWLIDAIDRVVIFLVLYFYLFKIAQQDQKCNVVFMFISGYTLRYGIAFLIYAIISFGLDSLSKYIGGQTVDEAGNLVQGYTNSIMIWLEFETLADMILIIGLVLLLFLYRKQLSKIVLWIGVGCFFGPLFFELLGLVTKVDFIYTYLTRISYLASIICGCFFYFKLADQSSSENVGQVYSPV